uniref:PH domain-containing protein n=1 Tax=Anguilla anguilla TaxID=7936 RepID=A0A0E9T2L8_ANGAN
MVREGRLVFFFFREKEQAPSWMQEVVMLCFMNIHLSELGTATYG